MNTKFTLFALLVAPAFADSLFVPGGWANTDADSNGISPLSVGSYFLNSGAQGAGQMEQLYDGSEFLSLGSTLNIDAVSFRDDAADSPYGNTATLQDIQVYMETTSQTIGGLGDTFASGDPNAVLVYSGSVTFTVPYDNGSPRCFCYTINFTTPFAYTPADGNLILDIVIDQGNDPNNSSIPSLDYSRSTTSSSVLVDYNSATDATGSVGTDQGWPTQFSYSVGDAAVPEPGAFLLAAAGLAAIGLRHVRRGSSRRATQFSRVSTTSRF